MYRTPDVRTPYQSPAAILRAANPDALTQGEETFSRNIGGSGFFAIGAGIVQLSFFTAVGSPLISKVRTSSGGAVPVGPTLIRCGIYEIAANGNGTLIASTPNDTALFAANGVYTKNLSAAVQLRANQRYAVGWALAAATTTPSLNGIFQMSGGLGARPYIDGYVAGADLVASFTDAAVVTNFGFKIYTQLLTAAAV